MTSTEIAIPDRNGQVAERDVVDGWLAMASDVIKLANVIAPTEFVPAEYRDNPPAVAAAILSGRELGIGPMTALRHVQMVKGTPTLSAEYKRARVLAAGHEFDVLELNTTRCRVSGRRKGSNKPPLEITYTMEDARTAGLLTPSKSGRPGAWQTRPRRMLFARAGSELCDFLFADVVNGLPTAELVADGSEADEFAGYNELPAATTEAPKPRTAQRKRQTHIDQGEQGINLPPQAPAAEAKSAPPPPQDTTLPPLPGEEQPEEPDYDTPGTITRPQLTKIAVLMGELGYTPKQRDDRRKLASRIVGRELESSADLSRTEAGILIDTIELCGADYERLAAVLDAADKPEDTVDP